MLRGDDLAIEAIAPYWYLHVLRCMLTAFGRWRGYGQSAKAPAWTGDFKASMSTNKDTEPS